MQTTLDFDPLPLELVAGVDEAGRGPLAGPVVAAAVILDPLRPIEGLNDSKKLTADKREQLFAEICGKAKAFAISEASVLEIDTINILQASLLAMKRAVELLHIPPQKILVDGTFCPKVNMPSVAIINGDALIQEISAASILAKVHRDRLMQQLNLEHPGYNFAQHMGYSTPQHLALLKKLGPCLIHRKTFAPVRELLTNITF
jgi:ribonuclease HII